MTLFRKALLMSFDHQVKDGVGQVINPGDKLLYVTTKGPKICVVDSITITISKAGLKVNGIYVRKKSRYGNGSYYTRIWKPNLYLKVGHEGENSITIPEKVEAVLISAV
jgi:hypothetical protein